MSYERKHKLSYFKYAIYASFLFCFTTVYLIYSMAPERFSVSYSFQQLSFNYVPEGSFFLYIFVDLYEQAASYITKGTYFISSFFDLFGDPNSNEITKEVAFKKNIFALCFPFFISFLMVLIIITSLSAPRSFLCSLLTNLSIAFTEFLLTASNEVSQSASIAYSMEQVAGYSILNALIFLILYFFGIMIFGRYRKDD